MIAEQDERNQYIELKCAEKAFRVALYASFMTIIAGMIAFGLTREYAFIWLVMGDCALRNIKNCLYRFCIPIRQAINGSRKALNEKLRGQDTSFGCVLASIYQLF